jgi:hypothetical protein
MTPERKDFEERIADALVRASRRRKDRDDEDDRYDERGYDPRDEERYEERSSTPSPAVGADTVVIHQPGTSVGTVLKWMGLLTGIFAAGYLLRGWGEATNGTSGLFHTIKGGRDPEEEPPPPAPAVLPYGGMTAPPWMQDSNYFPPPSAGVRIDLPDGRHITAPTAQEARRLLARLGQDENP